MEAHSRATERHLSYEITQYYLAVTRHNWPHPALTG